jgi:hypothetical protein
LGYEYPVQDKISAGVWLSCLFSKCWNGFYTESGDLEGDYISYQNPAGTGPSTQGSIQDLSLFSAGISASFRFPKQMISIKLDLGYNFSQIIVAKIGFGFRGFFVKGMLGYPVDDTWTTYFDDGGIFAIEGGYELKL